MYALTSGGSPYARFRLEAPDATLEDVQTAAGNLAAVAMGFPGALERLADLLRDCGIRQV
jgi:hypothetical protein